MTIIEEEKEGRNVQSRISLVKPQFLTGDGDDADIEDVRITLMTDTKLLTARSERKQGIKNMHTMLTS